MFVIFSFIQNDLNDNDDDRDNHDDDNNETKQVEGSCLTDSNKTRYSPKIGLAYESISSKQNEGIIKSRNIIGFPRKIG